MTLFILYVITIIGTCTVLSSILPHVHTDTLVLTTEESINKEMQTSNKQSHSKRNIFQIIMDMNLLFNLHLIPEIFDFPTLM